jgi:hypothetical protein
VRRLDADARVGGGDAMYLTKKTTDIGDVLEDVTANDQLEGTVAEWPRKRVEIVDDVDGRQGAAVYAERAGRFSFPATNVENPRGRAGSGGTELTGLRGFATGVRMVGHGQPVVSARGAACNDGERGP